MSGKCQGSLNFLGHQGIIVLADQGKSTLVAGSQGDAKEAWGGEGGVGGVLALACPCPPMRYCCCRAEKGVYSGWKDT